MTRDRIRKGSVSLIAILLIVILMALPTGYEDAAIYKGTDRVRAKVLSTDESSVINNGLIQSGEQYCKVKILGGKFKGEETKAVNMLSWLTCVSTRTIIRTLSSTAKVWLQEMT